MGTVTRLDEVRHARRTTRHVGTPDREDRADRARRYRFRAEELRSISQEVMLKETCLTLLSLAESYEQFAATMDSMSREEA